jgi:Ca2+/Na+ antiporter
VRRPFIPLALNLSSCLVATDFLLAPSKEIFDAVASKCISIIDVWEAEQKGVAPADIVPDDQIDFDDEATLIAFPVGGSPLEILFHVLLFPIKLLMHLTIPDVRHLDAEGSPKGGLGTAALAITMCLVWLIVGSYAMVASLEDLAELMDIPDAIIGVTVSAAGTSLPNYVASKVAAQQGFGVSAV